MSSDHGTVAATIESCAEALPTVTPKAYDCVQSNLALLANVSRGPEAALRLGRHLVVVARPLGNGLCTLDPEPEAEVDRCERLLGISAGRRSAVPAGRLADHVVAARGVCYAVGDAFDMPWLPYHGRVRMSHGFLVGAGHDESTAVVVDAYDNRTEWGPAVPGWWRLPWAALAFPVQLWTQWTVVAVPSPRSQVERRNVAAYVAALRAHEDRVRSWEQLAVDTWLLARRHRLFALAHEDDADLSSPAREAAARCEGLATEVFLGLRRVRQGRRESSAVIDEMEQVLSLPLSPAREGTGAAL